MLRLSLALCAFVWCTACAVAGPSSVFLEDLTWTELRDAITGGTTTVIIPVGGTEQNGPLMALGKHNVRVKALAGMIASGLGNALVAPVVAYVPEGTIEPPEAHMRFPGTITLPDGAFETLLEYAARSLKRHGFRNIVLIGDHGGYQKDLSAVADKLNKEWGKGATRIHAVLDYYRASQEPYHEALKAHGIHDNEIGTHAGLADTSLMLAVEPRLVRQDGLKDAGKLGDADGVHGGDPSRSSAELGALGVRIIVDQTIEAIRKVVGR